MNKYGIIIDSTFYFSDKELARMDIKKVSLNLIDKNESFKEAEIDNKFVHDRLNAGHKLTTSQPSPGEFLDAYEEMFAKGHEKIFVLTLAKPLSGTYQSALLARNMLDDQSKVHVFQSILASFGNELLTERLYELIEQDKSVEDIVSQIETYIKNSHLIISVGSLISMFKSGRLSRTKAAIGTVMRIKPIIKMGEGKLDLFKSARSHKKVISEMMEYMTVSSKGFKKMFVRIQSHNNMEQAKQIEALVKEKFEHAVISFNDFLGPIFNLHIGTKGYGVAWCGE